MNLKEDIKPISYIKTNAADMLKRVNDTHNPIVITQNGEAKAVLLDTESYQDMRNSLGILKILADGEKAAEDGKVYSQKDVFDMMENKLNKMKEKE
ncbi:type II toxin-antitoxin system Phd/YefM family antitoxin [Sediminispirochaeta smaragdinae]|uniref:Antitoxin n=1 Tax=Sediminispirochaeta smaragdinae (strain DSM 11293 / JCM 15392 / SEBR 4228) TaxID=573413 RepID=E1R2J5_SEDSS|nr:type II toxin-antitoxin system Phd/YefM family antitoxin [Sediminispirochaeta smaragdinae]ADK82555.1 prevent-host-death family protein [Sediminispirochaeta smaragdinae DSM 11293]